MGSFSPVRGETCHDTRSVREIQHQRLQNGGSCAEHFLVEHQSLVEHGAAFGGAGTKTEPALAAPAGVPDGLLQNGMLGTGFETFRCRGQILGMRHAVVMEQHDAGM